MKYWLFDGDETQGPFSLDELKRLEGYSPDSLICPTTAVGDNPWRPAKEFPEMHPVFLKPPPPPGRPKPPPPPPPPKAPGAAPAPPPPQARPARSCPRCGGRAPTGSAYCNHCGARLDAAAAAPARRKRSASMGPMILVASSAAAALSWIAYTAFNKPPAESSPQASPESPRASEDPWKDREEDAMDFTAAFPLKAPLFAKCPGSVEELSDIGPKPLAQIETWKPVKTLGDQFRCRPLVELAYQAVLMAQTKEIKPEEAARQVIAGIADIGGPEKFYSSSWTATRVAGAVYRVEASVEDEINSAAQESYFPEITGLRDEFKALGAPGGSDPEGPRKRLFLVDLAAKTLKPANYAGWMELDAKAAADWARREVEAHPGGKVAKGQADSVALGDAAPAYGEESVKPGRKKKEPKRK